MNWEAFLFYLMYLMCLFVSWIWYYLYMDKKVKVKEAT